MFFADSWELRGWQRGLHKARYRLFAGLEGVLGRALSSVSPDIYAVMSILLLGKRVDSGFPLLRAFRGAGCLHLLALSGFHVGLIALFFRTLLKPVLGYTASSLVSLAAAVFFLILVGGGPSLIRAVLLYALWTLARLRHRHVRGFNQLCLVFLIHFILRPADVSALSFQLSYAALAGILTSGRSLAFLLQRRFSRSAAVVAGAGFGAQMFTLPLVVVNFGVWRPVGLLAAPLLTPFLGMSMLGGVLLCVFEILMPGSAVVLRTAGLLEKLLQAETAAAVFFARVPGIPMSIMWSWLLAVSAAIMPLLAVWRKHYEKPACIESRFPRLNPLSAGEPQSGSAKTLGAEFPDKQGGPGENPFPSGCGGRSDGVGNWRRPGGHEPASPGQGCEPYHF